MTTIDFKRWLAFGTGVGIEIGREDLHVMVARIRPSGAIILGELNIPRFRETPASEWGASYAAFLKKLELSHLAATVLLPREEIVVRQVLLPGVSDKDLGAAIRFELDALQPYADADSVSGWSRIGKTASVLVGMARRDTIARYSSLLAEAGVKVAALTFSAPAIYSALRLYAAPPPGGIVTLAEEEDELEIYGESPTWPLFSARLDAALARARDLAISELRLAPETAPVPLQDALPHPIAAPADVDRSRTALAYSAALAAAAPRPSLAVNLLPAEQRQISSRLRYAPTLVLAGIALLMAAVVLAYPSYADRRYLGLLQAEVRKLEPRAKEAATLDRIIATSRNRSQVLDTFRRQTKEDMEALGELTNLIKSPAWLNSLQLTRDSVSLSGEAEQAAPLLKILDGSRQFKSSDFTLPLARNGSSENFSIRSTRQAGVQ
jgi:Tfp pilus assembly protein PilN